MRRLSRRLALPIFGVFWITVLLFFWVAKKNLEVSTGPEVQTPKVRGVAARRARGSGFAGGRAARARCLQALGKPGRGSGCREQVTGSRMRLQCDISGLKKAQGHLRARGSGSGWWARAPGQSGTLNLGSAPRSQGGGGAAGEPNREGGGLGTPRDSRGCLGLVAGPAGAGAREKSGGCTDLLPARSCQARPREAGGPGCAARVSLWRAPCSLPHPACRHPCFIIVPEPFSRVGN